MRNPIMGYALHLLKKERKRLAWKPNPTWQTEARIRDLNAAIETLEAECVTECVE